MDSSIIMMSEEEFLETQIPQNQILTSVWVSKNSSSDIIIMEESIPPPNL